MTDKKFFAAWRGYYTDGTCFIQICGLRPFHNESYHVRERKLEERGIKLGDFLSATVPLGSGVKNFVFLNDLKCDVMVEGNFAIIKNQEAKLERNEKGILVFWNETFGVMRAVNQSLPPGNHRITIRGTKPSEEDLFDGIPLCAEVEAVQLSSQTSSSSVTNGSGFSSSTNEHRGKKKMRAFVHGIFKREGVNTHFLWICDNQEKSIYTSKSQSLPLGHFFEGIFEETPKGKSKWGCVKYVKEINPLLNSSIDRNKLELTTSVSQYQAPFGAMKHPTVYSEHLGTIIDNQKKLPVNCYRRDITTQLHKVGDDFKWVVVDILR